VFNIPEMWYQIQNTADYQKRLQAINTYNMNNRWTKRGISLVPVKFGVYWAGNPMGSVVNIYSDGTVTVAHSGIEMGQGIHTKAIQACAMSLGIPMSLITVVPTSTSAVPNAGASGGSVTSEFIVQATLLACAILNGRLEPVRKAVGNSASWETLISTAVGMGVDLGAKGWFNPGLSPNGPQQYQSFGVNCTEVEIDVLTGEIQILRSDILFDCGISMNPAIDIGQIEGAFVMGLGYHLTEEMIYGTANNPGELVTDGTWEYKVPSSKDIPIDFRVTLLKNSYNTFGVLGSKVVGEPPLIMSCSALFAAKHAITSARSDAGTTGYFGYNSPSTIDNIQQNCLVQISQFTFQ